MLAIGFLLVILSSALWHKYWPLLVVAIYIVAPLPNWICGRCANPDDFMDSSSNSAMDFGRFMTGFLVLTGIGELCVLVPPCPADNVSPTVIPSHLCHSIKSCLHGRGESIVFSAWRSSIILNSSADTPLSRSTPRSSGTQRSDRDSRYDHVHLRRSIDLRYYHQLLDVFPGAGRVLIVDEWVGNASYAYNLFL